MSAPHRHLFGHHSFSACWCAEIRLVDISGALGSHMYDLIYFICGVRPVAVSAAFQSLYPHRPYASPEGGEESSPVTSEDMADVQLRFADGSTGSIYVSMMAAEEVGSVQFRVVGDEATLVMSSLTNDARRCAHGGDCRQEGGWEVLGCDTRLSVTGMCPG